jgi:hypothetical protein
MKINIFLDDERYPEDVKWLELPDVEWCIVRTALDFKDLVINYGISNINYISFDHDINDWSGPDDSREVTGYDLLKWMCSEAEKIDLLPKCLFHTQNTIGRRNMESYYINYINFIDDKNQIHWYNNL